jgi:uncharacterized Zn finger protein
MSYYDGWAPYVPVAERRKKAAQHVQTQKKKGKNLYPIVISGRTIAHTFWGKAWCEHLESYSDNENRLPRGRTYARNGSIIDLQVTPGTVKAQVMGSKLYKVTITVQQLPQHKWQKLIQLCSGKIDSLIELLQGKFSKSVMAILTEKNTGLFPNSNEIELQCSCPDYAYMCKHVAAVLYGIGAAIDTLPEWLFKLRQVNHTELITQIRPDDAILTAKDDSHLIAEESLSELFGIELENNIEPQNIPAVLIQPEVPPKRKRGRPKKQIP